MDDTKSLPALESGIATYVATPKEEMKELARSEFWRLCQWIVERLQP